MSGFQRTVALGAAMGTLAGLARVPFAAIPDVQPATALVVLAGAALGARVGLLSGAMVPLVSNAFLGHGPWTPFQMLAWGLIGAASAALGPRAGRLRLVAAGVVFGFAFGLVMDGWVWLTSVRPLSLPGLLPVLLRGVPFNVAHALGNAVVLAAVGPRLLLLLGRVRLRRMVVPFEAPGAAASHKG